MDATRFSRVESLFQAALERPAAERDAFVRASTDDADIREGLADVLREHAFEVNSACPSHAEFTSNEYSRSTSASPSRTSASSSTTRIRTRRP